MKKSVVIIILSLLISIPIFFSGWASADEMTATQKGAVGGGAVGAVTGALLGGGKGALIGAGVGALGGALANDALEKGKEKDKEKSK
ncbi:MAG: YMGG-like glycine zipper-containing protein [Desulfosarcina sp.]|jgi:outer membrane lipoprotein SlyB